MFDKQISIQELSEIIVQAISSEPYFNKDILIPKIKAILSGWRFKASTAKYNRIENPTKMAKLLRLNELYILEMNFLNNELSKNLNEETRNKIYDKLNKERLVWRGE